MPQFQTWTSGTLSRLFNGERFLKSEHSHLFMLDADMIYPADCLERLRAHDLPVVSGLYVRRDPSEPLPCAWYEPREVEDFPHVPLLEFPDDGLIPVGAVGHGFLLMTREVVEDLVKALEPEPLFVRAPMPEWTGKGDLPVGPDVRMGLWIRRLGYRIWLDTGCRAAHCATVPLTVEYYQSGPWRFHNKWREHAALARILRRRAMAGEKSIGLEEIELLSTQAQQDLNNLKKQRQAIDQQAMKVARELQAKQGQIDAEIHARQGALTAYEQLFRAARGELTEVTRKKAE